MKIRLLYPGLIRLVNKTRYDFLCAGFCAAHCTVGTHAGSDRHFSQPAIQYGGGVSCFSHVRQYAVYIVFCTCCCCCCCCKCYLPLSFFCSIRRCSSPTRTWLTDVQLYTGVFFCPSYPYSICALCTTARAYARNSSSNRRFAHMLAEHSAVPSKSLFVPYVNY